MNKEAVQEIRSDIWLWAARFYKTRSVAKHMLASGKIELANQPIKPSRLLRVGDVLRVNRAGEFYEITILALSDVRGPASIAQALYHESEQSKIKRESEREMRRLSNAGYKPPAGKPDKRARRLIQALGDLDAL